MTGRTSLKSVWTSWKCNDGMTTFFRDHLGTKHLDEWVRLLGEKNITVRGSKWHNVVNAKLGRATTTEGRPQIDLDVHEEFTLEGFIKRLTRWVADDDQVQFHLLYSFSFCQH